jgi:hypothetical protein
MATKGTKKTLCSGKWIRYRHTFSYGKGRWTWRHYPLDFSLREIRENLSNEYNYSDKYGGVELSYITDENVPIQVWEKEIEWQETQAASCTKFAKELRKRIKKSKKNSNIGPLAYNNEGWIEPGKKVEEDLV